jgi:hypothetical protein
MGNRLHLKGKDRVSFMQILDLVRKDKELSSKVNKFKVGLNAKGDNYLITNELGEKVSKLRLDEVYYLIQAKLGVSLDYLDFVNILKTRIIESLTEEEKQLLENEERVANSPSNFLEGNTERLTNSINQLDVPYFRTETICDLIKEVLGQEISVHDPRVSKFLEEMGYVKIRKRIEGKQIRVWAKGN